jgi:hypothetical protein
VTQFFIPGLAVGSKELESAYERIRNEIEADTGLPTSKRRIFKVDCRRDGTDYEARVGRRDAVAGRRIVAIFDLGGGVYAIRCAGDAASPCNAPIIVGRRQVYSVTEFAA